MAATWHHGPPPGDWPIVQNLLVFHNDLRDIELPVPRANCRWGQKYRSGIRLEPGGNVRDTVLYANRCRNVALAIDDGGVGTSRICRPELADACECVGNSTH